MNGVKVYFDMNKKAVGRCIPCNKKIDIQSLIDTLVKFTTYSCPQELYQAWKILILGTVDYNKDADTEHVILSAALSFTNKRICYRCENPLEVDDDNECLLCTQKSLGKVN